MVRSDELSMRNILIGLLLTKSYSSRYRCSAGESQQINCFFQASGGRQDSLSTKLCDFLFSTSAMSSGLTLIEALWNASAMDGFNETKMMITETRFIFSDSEAKAVLSLLRMFTN